MSSWMIISTILLLACAVLAVLWLREQRDKQFHIQQLYNDIRALERSVSRLKNDQARRGQELALLRRELELERERGDSLVTESGDRTALYQEAVERAQSEEKRRIEAERGISAMKMREELLEKQRVELKRQKEELLVEQNEQARVFQEILHDQEETIARLQGAQAKKKRKPAVLEQQVTLDEVLDAPNPN
ncbi:MAG: hypothetical protein IJ074_02675 [Clostridia bacterium]|nr:hypothetical protein [Clostridia bacterium]MBQ8971969.1 hypothetical protein [Clostridia bacterium]